MAKKKTPRVRLPLRVDAAGSTLSVSWLDRGTEAAVWAPDYGNDTALTMWLDGRGRCGGFRVECAKPKVAAEAVRDFRKRARFVPSVDGYSYLSLIRKRAGRRFHRCVIFDGDTIVADVDKRGVPLGLEFTTAEVSRPLTWRKERSEFLRPHPSRQARMRLVLRPTDAPETIRDLRRVLDDL